jgi:alkanesulfonate monooxygenase SsuD/methylene tetrahydromethanopterin reductase-like flavin-dependent oxidoreductase (luciferase family)
MPNLEFGTYDLFQWNVIEAVPEPVDYYDQHLSEVHLAEEVGFKYHFIIEHQGNNVGQCTAPTVYLSALAQRTSTLRFGAMIFQLPFYNPMRLAQDAAMIDQLSRGRLEFGAGIGVLEHEFIRWNLPFHERRAVSEETLDIIKRAWTEETVTHQGKYWSFDEAIPMPRPYQKPHPPIWFACHSPTSFEYAALHNYDVSQNLDVDPVIAEKFDMWRDMWKAQGHPGPMPRTFLTRAIHVAETDELAKEEAEPYLVQAYASGVDRLERTRVGYKGTEDNPTTREIRRVFEGMATGLDFWLDNGLAHVGSPETVARRLEQQQQRIGMDIFCGRHRFGQIPDPLVEKSIRLFGEKVIPAFS